MRVGGGRGWREEDGVDDLVVVAYQLSGEEGGGEGMEENVLVCVEGDDLGF